MIDKSSEIVLFLMLICIMYLVIFGLIATDLWAGVRKAKQRGEMRTSEAYKRTITKISRYYNMAFALSLVDITQSALVFYLDYCYNYGLPLIPLFTFIGTSGSLKPVLYPSLQTSRKGSNRRTSRG